MLVHHVEENWYLSPRVFFSLETNTPNNPSRTSNMMIPDDISDQMVQCTIPNKLIRFLDQPDLQLFDGGTLEGLLRALEVMLLRYHTYRNST
jgi:hypothetical protein